jgi:hypothetical protein
MESKIRRKMRIFLCPERWFELVFQPYVLPAGMRALVKRNPACVGGRCAPNEVRTRVSALRGLRPGPLDNGGGERRNFTISHRLRQL